MGSVSLEGFGGGGGTSLNFKVVGNPQPSNPKDNTIWVDTDVKITGWFFSATEPENPAEGMVWIITGTSRAAAFNALKKNGIMVYPLSAKQYVGGVFVKVDAKTYFNGEWTQWGGLPAKYQRVEYIQTTGTQCIDTGIIPSDNTYQVHTKIAVSDGANNMPVFGTAYGNSNYHLTTFSSQWYAGTNGTEAHGGSYSNAIGTQYEIFFNDNNHNVAVNGSPVITNKIYTSNASIVISQRPFDGRFGAYKYYYFRIINNETGEVLMDLVPCYRRSDSVAGMYDLVSGEFFTNAGTGTFVVGGDVV